MTTDNQPDRSTRHTMPLLHAHLVVVTKCRRRVFTDEMLLYCEHTMRGVCSGFDVELIEFNGEADHVHLLATYPPTPPIPVLAQQPRACTPYAVRREITGVCVRTHMRGHLWSSSYFAASRGGAPLSIVKQCIDGQSRPS